MDARQRLLDALAEVERLDLASRGESHPRRFEHAHHELDLALRELLPTLAALREVVEMHQPIRTQWDAGVRPVTYVEMCRGCRGLPHPCPTLRTLTRQFEKE